MLSRKILPALQALSWEEKNFDVCVLVAWSETDVTLSKFSDVTSLKSNDQD